MSKHVKDVTFDLENNQVNIEEDTIKLSDLVLVGQPYKLKGYTIKNSAITAAVIIVVWCIFFYFLYGQAILVQYLPFVLIAAVVYIAADWLFTHKRFPDTWVCSMHDIGMKYNFEAQLTDSQLAKVKEQVQIANSK